MNVESVGRVLLLGLLVASYAFPAKLPIIGVSLHGVVLLSLLTFLVIFHRSALLARRVWPYWGVAAAMALSVLVAGGGDVAASRGIAFGLLTAIVIVAIGRAQDIPLAFAIVLPLLCLDTVLSAIIRLGPDDGNLWLREVWSAQLQRPLHRGIYMMMGMVAAGAMFIRSGRPAWLAPYALLALGVVLTALRGVWVGAAIGLFALLVLRPGRRPLIAIAVAGGVFFGVVRLMEAQYQRTGDLAEAAGRSTVVPPRVVTPAPAAPGGAPARPGTPAATRSAKVAESELQSARYAFDFTAKAGLAKFLEELSTAGRVGYWLAGFRMFADRPVTGVGLGNFTHRYPAYAADLKRRDAEETTDPHNVFVAIISQTGLVGVIAFSVLFGTIGRHAWRAWRHADAPDRTSLAALIAVFAALLGLSLTWDLQDQRAWWIGLALLHVGAIARSRGAPVAA
jgi:hypothetical protein